MKRHVWAQKTTKPFSSEEKQETVDLQIFISYVKTDLFTHGLLSISLIAFIRTGQMRIQDPFKHLRWNLL